MTHAIDLYKIKRVGHKNFYCEDTDFSIKYYFYDEIIKNMYKLTLFIIFILAEARDAM